MLPDIDRFYREFMGRPLEDEGEDWFEDRTHTKTNAWAKGEK